MRATIGIDIGSDRIRIYSGHSIVLDEPSCIAVKVYSGEPVAFGQKARDMIGKTGENVSVINPIQRGVITEYEEALMLIKEYLGRVCKNKMIKPKVLCSMPSGLSAVQMRSIIRAVKAAGARTAALIESPIALAVGLDLDFSTPHGTVVVDVGAGTTDVAVLSLGRLVQCASAKTAGCDFDDAIVKYVRKKHNIVIGEMTARRIKEQIGCISKRNIEIGMTVKGNSIYTGLPISFEITANEVCEACEDVYSLMVKAIREVLERTPPELVSDAANDGIYLTGGGMLIHGFEKRLGEELSTKIKTVPDPINTVARGTGVALGNAKYFSKGGDYRYRNLGELILE
ncbi:MAG: rod shape-determining protein [Clostridia bacterium]|nr:rod shape-determining protein [Clostridia bacterium]